MINNKMRLFFSLAAIVLTISCSGNQPNGDINEALAFYGRLFEFELRGKSDTSAFIDLGDQFLALQKGRAQPPDDGRHFGLVVDDKEAVRRAFRVALAEPLGPVHLDASRDILLDKTESEPLMPAAYRPLSGPACSDAEPTAGRRRGQGLERWPAAACPMLGHIPSWPQDSGRRWIEKGRCEARARRLAAPLAWPHQFVADRATIHWHNADRTPTPATTAPQFASPRGRLRSGQDRPGFSRG